jgi:hypothetical protein
MQSFRKFVPPGHFLGVVLGTWKINRRERFLERLKRTWRPTYVPTDRPTDRPTWPRRTDRKTDGPRSQLPATHGPPAGRTRRWNGKSKKRHFLDSILFIFGVLCGVQRMNRLLEWAGCAQQFFKDAIGVNRLHTSKFDFIFSH